MNDERDRGSVIPLVALCMVGLLVIVALVIDFGATRSLRSDSRTATDLGATAGAVAMGAPGASMCRDAFKYTFNNLGITPPAAIDSTCSVAGGLDSACTSTTPKRIASVPAGGATVRVTNPVPDGDPLLSGTSLGSGVPQSINTALDGAACERVGVEVTRQQPAFFRGILGSTVSNYTVHTVARFQPQLRNITIPPALVALNQHTCSAVDAGNNGNIIVIGNSLGPGIAGSDSDGTAQGGCSGTNAILASKSSARLVAESSGSVPGQLVWYSAPSTAGYNNGASINQTAPATFATTSQNYVGQFSARAERITRSPADKRYHCTNVPTSVQPLCTTSDPISALQSLSASSRTSAPAGYATYSGPCDTTTGAVTFPSGNVWVNCPTFLVKGNPLSIPGGGTVIFKGTLSVDAGGTLRSNTSGAVDANGYPVASNSALQTTLVINDIATSDCSTSNKPCAFDISSNSSAIYLAQTTLFSNGGFRLTSSQTIRWTPPTSGDLQSLMYWSESTQPFSIQGSPQIFAKGILFQGNGQAIGGGGGTIDLTNVQMWMDRILTSGSTTVKLKADPDNSINVFGGGSSLIR